MKKFLLGICIAVLAAFTVMGCASKVTLHDSVGMIPSGITQEKFEAAVSAACSEYNWTLEKSADGALYAAQYKKWYAKVQIINEGSNFRIHYIESTGFKYNAEKNTIHPHYQTWIKNLSESIHNHLAMAK